MHLPVPLLKPAGLNQGDRVAIVSPSSGAAHSFPHVLELGLKNLENILGLETVEFPTCRMPDKELYRNPKLRAEDINRAFLDPSIKAIFSTIGGDDSVRILPYLDPSIILKNPKILMGFSDTTTLNAYLNPLGLVTFNGPSILARIAQMRHLPEAFTRQFQELLFEGRSPELRPFPVWAEEFVDWNTPGYNGRRNLTPTVGWHWLRGSGRLSGRLFGGCIEVLEFLKQTPFWPSLEFFDNKILFFETSEEKPSLTQVKYMLRNYGSMGALQRVKGLLFGRPLFYTKKEIEEFEAIIENVVVGEFGRPDLPIVTQMDFGHTDPQLILPLGIEIEIDCDAKKIQMLEPAVSLPDRELDRV